MSGTHGSKVRVQREKFDLERELAAVKSVSRTIGGVVIFLGVARDFSRGQQVGKLYYEYYPGMAEQTLESLRTETVGRFSLIDLRIVPRDGGLYPREDIVLILAAAEHRDEAFRACSWCMSELKGRAPIWKKEYTATGEVWVEEGRPGGNPSKPGEQ